VEDLLKAEGPAEKIVLVPEARPGFVTRRFLRDQFGEQILTRLRMHSQTDAARDSFAVLQIPNGVGSGKTAVMGQMFAELNKVEAVSESGVLECGAYVRFDFNTSTDCESRAELAKAKLIDLHGEMAKRLFCCEKCIREVERSGSGWLSRLNWASTTTSLSKRSTRR
jgi:hypothetical protein